MNKYQILGVIDQGAYGIVLQAKNKQNNSLVAIKKFKQTEDDQIVRKNIQRQVKMLRLLKSQFVVELKQAFKRKGKIYLVFQYFQKNLLNMLEQKPDGLPKIQSIIYQLTKSLQYMHQNSVIHRDIKPENILISSQMKLKLCDFGFARHLPKDQEFLTDYVATRWYRSPQLLLKQRYGIAIDMWAVGCIMGQLIDGQPLFPGQNEIDQLYLIQKTIGPLTHQQQQHFLKNPRFVGIKFPEIRQLETLQRKYLGKLTKNAMSFLKCCLKMDPQQRILAKEAIEHPYLKQMYGRDHIENELQSQLLGSNNIKVKKNFNIQKGQEIYISKSIQKKQINNFVKKDQVTIQNNPLHTLYHFQKDDSVNVSYFYQRFNKMCTTKKNKIPKKNINKEPQREEKIQYLSPYQLINSKNKLKQLPNISYQRNSNIKEQKGMTKILSQPFMGQGNSINLIYNNNTFNYLNKIKHKKK